MKKLESLATVFNKNETVLIVTSIDQIKEFENELKDMNKYIEEKDGNYGVFKKTENDVNPISVMLQGKTFYFLTINQFNQLFK